MAVNNPLATVDNSIFFSANENGHQEINTSLFLVTTGISGKSSDNSSLHLFIFQSIQTGSTPGDMNKFHLL